MIYLDTSALAKAFITEPGTDRVLQIIGTDPTLAFSVIAFAEFASMVARKIRDGVLTQAEGDVALARLRVEMARAQIIAVPGPDEPIVVEAVRLCRAHTLRGADSIHLATAIVLAREQPDDPLTFLSSDHRLLAAAAHEGLSAVDPTPQ